MKIGIYAGTFDPIHNGHIEFAQAAIRDTELERVIVIAEKEPYRKEASCTMGSPTGDDRACYPEH
jgi:nicotinate-nucleotide adenylyltransferase